MAWSSFKQVLPLALALIISATLISPSYSQCSNSITLQGTQTAYTRCQSLTQGASIAWTYHSSNSTVEMAFSGALLSSSGWVGWGYNPNGPGMDGSSALVAFVANDSSPRLNLYSLVKQGSNAGASFVSSNSTSHFTILSRAVEIQGTSVTFSAILQLAPGSSSSIGQVWNRGSSVSGDSLTPHPFNSENLNSLGRLDLSTGESSAGSIPRLHLKNAHGLVNAIGWGILLPIGAMSARYLRPFESADPAWFYLHVLCQTCGYILGVVGWVIGLKLGSDSVGVKYNSHRNIGITMFVFGTLQVFAIVLRPNKSHQYRMFWNVYHHSLGYTTIALAIVNIFKGLDILAPAKGWKRAYIGCIIALGVISLLLEVVTWIAYFKRRNSKANKINKAGSNPYGNDHQHHHHEETPALRV